MAMICCGLKIQILTCNVTIGSLPHPQLEAPSRKPKAWHVGTLVWAHSLPTSIMLHIEVVYMILRSLAGETPKVLEVLAMPAVLGHEAFWV